MKKTLVSKITKLLTQEREQLLIRQSETFDIDHQGDDIDLVQSNILANNHKQLMLRNAYRLKLIDSAITKISEGKYGICEECDEPIAEKRLLINPTCVMCISCAEHLELETRRNKA